jgi:hypothetical protein
MSRPDDPDIQFNRLAQGPPQKLRKGQYQRRWIRGRRVQRLTSTERQELTGEFCAVHRGVLSLLQKLTLIAIFNPHLQHFEIAGDHRQEVVEVMCDAAGQLTDRGGVTKSPNNLRWRRALCEQKLRLRQAAYAACGRGAASRPDLPDSDPRGGRRSIVKRCRPGTLSSLERSCPNLPRSQPVDRILRSH